MSRKPSLARSSVTLPSRGSAERRSNPRGRPPKGTQSNQTENPKATRGRILVGVDYGTTDTSVAYAYFPPGVDVRPRSLGAGLEGVKLVQTWPLGLRESFVPTVVMYDSAHGRSGTENLPKWWGHRVQRALDREEAPNTAQAVHLAKLVLHEARETETETNELKELAHKVRRRPIELIADFLRQLHTYLLGEGGYFQVHHEGWLADSDFEFFFGVPAAWSEPEQQAMIETAKSVGFTVASRGSEPEAMAASYFAQNETSVEIGDTFVICDAGGGTVDLITYTIVGLNPLLVSEASVAEGKFISVLCGSTYLNRGFKVALKRRLAGETYLQDLDRIIDNATREFDGSVKGGFDDKQKEHFHVPSLRPNEKKGFRAEKLWMSSKELREEVFDPVVHQIVYLIRKQIDSSRALALEEQKLEGRHDSLEPMKIKNIILGGGFAENRYLCRILEDAFSGNANAEDNIAIQKISTTGPAVAQGLVLMASNYGLVKQRRSRVNYGVLSRIVWIKELHGPKNIVKAVADRFDRDEKCSWVKVIDWLIRKGQPIPSNIKIPIREREWNVNYLDIGVKMPVYECDSDVPANKDTLLVNKPKGCRETELEIDFPDEPMDNIFLKKKNKNFYTVYWDVSLTVQGGFLTWAVTLKLKDGRRLVKQYKPISLDSEETSSRILGSLADRVLPVNPRSNLDPRPLTPQKRKRGRNVGSSKKKSRFARYSSACEVESDTDYQPDFIDKAGSETES